MGTESEVAEADSMALLSQFREANRCHKNAQLLCFILPDVSGAVPVAAGELDCRTG